MSHTYFIPMPPPLPLPRGKRMDILKHSRNSINLKKIKSGPLKHVILREFEISKSTYYRLIIREHVLLLKNLPKRKFLLIILYF